MQPELSSIHSWEKVLAEEWNQCEAANAKEKKYSGEKPAMLEALRRRQIPCLYVRLDGEQHGIRRADNIKRALDAELYFYSVFLSGAKLLFAT